jgi:rubrerythrin
MTTKPTGFEQLSLQDLYTIRELISELPEEMLMRDTEYEDLRFRVHLEWERRDADLVATGNCPECGVELINEECPSCGATYGV